MIGFIKRLWSAAPIAVVILVIALLASGFFAFRTTVFWIYWHDPSHQEQQIAGWMTPSYIAHSWHVPREVVLDALEPDWHPEGRPRNFDELSRELNIPAEDLMARVETAIAEFVASQPPRPGAPSPDAAEPRP